MHLKIISSKNKHIKEFYNHVKETVLNFPTATVDKVIESMN